MNGVTKVKGKTVIEGTTVRTSDVIDRFLEGVTDAEAIAQEYLERGVLMTSAQIQAAIRYECCRTCKCDKCAWARDL